MILIIKHLKKNVLSFLEIEEKSKSKFKSLKENKNINKTIEGLFEIIEYYDINHEINNLLLTLLLKTNKNDFCIYFRRLIYSLTFKDRIFFQNYIKKNFNNEIKQNISNLFYEKSMKEVFFEFIEKEIELNKDDKINYNTRLKNLSGFQKILYR